MSRSRALLLTLSLLGCSDRLAERLEGRPGAVDVELAVSGVEVETLSYVVTGNGIIPLEGVVDVRGANSPPVLGFSLPVGSGYEITVSGESADGLATCSGTEEFAVEANIPTRVEVSVDCELRDKGGVDVDVGGANVCPDITHLRLSRASGYVGSTVGVRVEARDLDGDPLVYSFLDALGAFEEVSGSEARYRCPRVGTHPITVTVSDGRCGDEFATEIRCEVSPFCGNGAPDPHEPCDDGNRMGGDGCASDCSKVEVCGDAFMDEGESCDDGNAGGCRSDCRRCGDGVAQASYEQCDDGNTVNEDGCTNACDLPRCGDVICSTTETCLACESDCGVCTATEISRLFDDPNHFAWVKGELAFQTASASFDYSSEEIKLRYEGWSDDPDDIPNRADLAEAIGEAWEWFLGTERFAALGQPETALTPVGNGGPTASNPSSFPEYHVPLEHAWRLYVWWVAHNIVLELREEVGWRLESMAGASVRPLAALFDGTEMMHRDASDVALGHAPGFGYLGKPYASYLGATVLGTPRYTYRFLVEQGLLGATRAETEARVLDWVGAHLVRSSGLSNRVTAQDHWGHPSNPTLEMLVEGTVRTSDQAFGHYTLDCFGTAQFVKDLLRAANIPVRVPLNCQHAQLWFPADDLYVVHAEDPYNPSFRASPCTGEDLLVNRATWESLYGVPNTNRFPANCVTALPHSVTPAALAACQ